MHVKQRGSLSASAGASHQQDPPSRAAHRGQVVRQVHRGFSGSPGQVCIAGQPAKVTETLASAGAGPCTCFSLGVQLTDVNDILTLGNYMTHFSFVLGKFRQDCSMSK